MRKIDEIIVHCSATAPDWLRAEGLAAQIPVIRHWHTKNGWRDVGYHEFIGRKGDLGHGRPIAQEGAHTRGHNKTSIGICLIGGRGASADDKWQDHFTPEQMKTLRERIEYWQDRLGPAPLKISGHNEYANKGCPGFRVKPWLRAQQKPRSIWDVIIEAIINLFGGRK